METNDRKKQINLLNIYYTTNIKNDYNIYNFDITLLSSSVNDLYDKYVRSIDVVVQEDITSEIINKLNKELKEEKLQLLNSLKSNKSNFDNLDDILSNKKISQEIITFSDMKSYNDNIKELSSSSLRNLKYSNIIDNIDNYVLLDIILYKDKIYNQKDIVIWKEKDKDEAKDNDTYIKINNESIKLKELKEFKNLEPLKLSSPSNQDITPKSFSEEEFHCIYNIINKKDSHELFKENSRLADRIRSEYQSRYRTNNDYDNEINYDTQSNFIDSSIDGKIDEDKNNKILPELEKILNRVKDNLISDSVHLKKFIKDEIKIRLYMYYLKCYNDNNLLDNFSIPNLLGTMIGLNDTKIAELKSKIIKEAKSETLFSKIDKYFDNMKGIFENRKINELKKKLNIFIKNIIKNNTSHLYLKQIRDYSSIKIDNEIKLLNESELSIKQSKNDKKIYNNAIILHNELNKQNIKKIFNKKNIYEFYNQTNIVPYNLDDGIINKLTTESNTESDDNLIKNIISFLFQSNSEFNHKVKNKVQPYKLLNYSIQTFKKKEIIKKSTGQTMNISGNLLNGEKKISESQAITNKVLLHLKLKNITKSEDSNKTKKDTTTKKNIMTNAPDIEDYIPSSSDCKSLKREIINKWNNILKTKKLKFNFNSKYNYNYNYIKTQYEEYNKRILYYVEEEEDKNNINPTFYKFKSNKELYHINAFNTESKNPTLQIIHPEKVSLYNKVETKPDTTSDTPKIPLDFLKNPYYTIESNSDKQRGGKVSYKRKRSNYKNPKKTKKKSN